MPDNELLHILANEGSLTIRLESLHNSIIEKVPVVDRIACAIYDEKTDLLKTFVNSTKKGQAIEGYEYELSKSQSLKKLFERRETRVIDHIADIVGHGVEHSDWLLDQDYQSSFTIPMYSAGKFVGFLFFDSCTESAFTDRVQRDLLLLGNLVIMLVTSEIAAVRSLLATAKAARDFAHLRDFETGRHLDRMAYLSRLIARHIKDKYHLSDETIEHIFLFAPLHDIGKIGVPDCILLKPGRLDPEERTEIETHVAKGVSIIQKVLNDYQLQSLNDSQLMLDIVAHHHEMLDGTGYPAGLKGDEISIVGRIITVADIFDALTSRRPYKEPWPIADALEELDTLVDRGKLDPDCVAALKSHRAEIENLVTQLAD